MATYKSESNSHSLRMGGSNGVQICFGSFSGNRPCTIGLNNVDTIYTGVTKKDDSTDNGTLQDFAEDFGSNPFIMAAPTVSDCWYGDILAEDKSHPTRLDFYRHSSKSSVAVDGKYLAIGAIKSTFPSGTLSDVTAYWNGANTVRIVAEGLDGTVQICSGSISNTGTFASLGNNIYCTSIKASKDFEETFASNTVPVVLTSPSMKCRKWGDDDTFTHPYWFGGVTASNSVITSLNVYTNKSISKQSIYGRYIAIGLANNNVSGWTKVSVSLSTGSRGEYVLRFNDDASGSGMQIAFGNISYGDRKIQKALNGSSNIYTAYKEAPAYTDEAIMYFSKAFSESPSTILVPAARCRTASKTFANPYWCGDAASDAVSIFDLDIYTNYKFTTAQSVEVKYLAAGQYTAKSDWARDFILNALSYKNKTHVNGREIGEYIVQKYKGFTGSNEDDGSAWCSEFASVTLHDGKNDTAKSYPHHIAVRGFVEDFSGNTKTPVEATQFYLLNKSLEFVAATKDKTLNESSDYMYGGIRNSDGKDLRFSCTLVSGGATVEPEIGDLIFFAESESCHTGIVINKNGSYIFTVEGNVTNDDGDKAVLHLRKKITATKGSGCIAGIGKVYEQHLAH